MNFFMFHLITLLTDCITYLASLLHNYSPSRTMRSSSAKLLTVPRHNLLLLGSRAFRISAPTTWNSLPVIVHHLLVF